MQFLIMIFVLRIMIFSMEIFPIRDYKVIFKIRRRSWLILV